MSASALADARARTPTLVSALALLAGAMLFLLPFGRSSEVPLALAGVLGVLSMATAGRARWREPVLRLGLILFLCYWVPALLSATDAVEPERSWSTVLVDLRFLPFALALVWMLGGASRPQGLLRDGGRADRRALGARRAGAGRDRHRSRW
jgi:hypothetical protein